MRVALVTGSRHWTDAEPLRHALAEFGADMVIHGGARGADRIADEWAAASERDALVCRAQWADHGKAAGPIRNRRMIALLKQMRHVGHTVRVIAAPLGQSRGTRGCMALAREAELPVYVVKKRGDIGVTDAGEAVPDKENTPGNRE